MLGVPGASRGTKIALVFVFRVLRKKDKVRSRRDGARRCGTDGRRPGWPRTLGTGRIGLGFFWIGVGVSVALVLVLALVFEPDVRGNGNLGLGAVSRES